jgi:hypothetical protein
MVAELIDWRLARYLFTTQVDAQGGFRLRVSQASGRPLVWLDRDRNPGVPSGETPFVADGEDYVGNFAKIALTVARRRRSNTNDLHALLRRWFGDSADQPGTDHHVELLRTAGRWLMRPAHAEIRGHEAADATA